MAFVDKTIKCRDCGIDFVFTAGEQEFYAEKGLLNEPQRCPSCRARRRAQRNSGTARQTYPVVCAMCGAETTVPFMPRQDRPVYCSTCYEKVRSEASR